MSLDLEVGQLKGRMDGFGREMGAVKDQVSKMDAKLDRVLDYISQQKGGWKATTILISLSGGTGAFVAYLLKRFLV